MTDEEKIKKAMSIGVFEMNPVVDTCKNCGNCELKLQTREYFSQGECRTVEVRAECKHANACRRVFEECMRRGD